MDPTVLTWRRFNTFIEARAAFRGTPCLYLQTDPQENILRVGECDDPWERYKGGTAYTLDAAGHNSGNLYFFSAVNAPSKIRKALEATLIFDLKPSYNNQHKGNPPLERIKYRHAGDVPSGLGSS